MKTKKTKKENYEVFEFNSGYYGICGKDKHGDNCIFGGDSADQDSYNEQYISNVFDQWDGTLYYSGDMCRWIIQL